MRPADLRPNPYAHLADIAPAGLAQAPRPVPVPPALPQAHFVGTAGDDDFTGSHGPDIFNMAQGGHDKVNGKNGLDTFSFGDTFEADDEVRGGDGIDFLNIAGASYAAGLVISGSMLQDVEQLIAGAGNDYKLTLKDAVIEASKLVLFDGHALGAVNSFKVDASEETDGRVQLIGGLGNDRLTGGAGNDLFYDAAFTAGPAGNETMSGGDGNDTFTFGQDFTAADKVDGGAGLFDAIIITGDYSSGVTLSGLTNVEQLFVNAGFDYLLKIKDTTVAAGASLTIVGSGLTSGDNLFVNGSAETDGTLNLAGGVANDSLVGGGGDDLFRGLTGADALEGGGGADEFQYLATNESANTAFDTIKGFDCTEDTFLIASGVSGVDAQVNGGTLSQGTFNADLTSAIGAGQLASDHAVIFKPNAGTFAGSVFLVIDNNNTAGYQAGGDYVIRFDDPSSLNQFGVGNF